MVWSEEHITKEQLSATHS